MNGGYSVYRNNRFFNSLDGVRFFSILAVIWHHTSPGEAAAFLERGFLGVDMFFVLSGYLIVTLLLREKDKQTISLKGFYIRRALRIFPIYFGVIFVIATALFIFKGDDAEGQSYISLLPIYLLFLANFSLVHIPTLSIYWSLATEEQFYIVWPLLEKYLQPRVILTILFVFIGFNQLINFGFLDNLIASLYGVEEVKLSILEATFTPICLGVLLAHLLHKEKNFTVFYSFLHYKFASTIIFLLLMLSIFISPEDISGFSRLFIQVMMFLWLASLVVRDDHWMAPLMTFYPIKRLGQISYGMYIFHLLVLHVVRIVLEKFNLETTVWLFVLCFLVTVIVSEISFRLYESPILALRKKFTPNR